MDKESNWLLADKYRGVETPEFKKDLERLKNGEPLAFIIGWAPFLHTKIWLGSKPLIPRSETEFWVDIAISEIKKLNKREIKVLDLCAGSGCIGVAVLKHIPNSEVHFAEIVDDHHQTIRKNIRENGVGVAQTKQIGGDLFEHVTEKYDFILTNPPYVDPTLAERIQPSVAAHEPELALFGGEHGMEIVERIIREAPQYLNPGGVLYIEHEPEQAEKIQALAPQAEIFEDQFRVKRFTRITF
ncbi:MAG: peptide chain release factor N(5)-glutamine methyltransferase [Bacteroidetes bacterium]|nr:peptide chain release factor N(5)-glutamine methyltransferase [Bacteroidota bacterium]